MNTLTLKSVKKPDEVKPAVDKDDPLLSLIGRHVLVEIINSKEITGILRGVRRYEISLETPDGVVIVWKHALATMRTA